VPPILTFELIVKDSPHLQSTSDDRIAFLSLLPLSILCTRPLSTASPPATNSQPSPPRNEASRSQSLNACKSNLIPLCSRHGCLRTLRSTTQLQSCDAWYLTASPFHKLRAFLLSNTFSALLRSALPSNEQRLISPPRNRTCRTIEMAVLKGLEGIEVTVRVDNSALHEYNDDEVSNELVPIGEYQASKTVSKYIEAVTGKEFTIAMTVRAPYQMDCPTLSFHVMVDGNLASNPLLRKSNYRGNNWEKKVAGIKHQLQGASKRCSIKNFLFAEIQTSRFDLQVKKFPINTTRS
jgi:hypothetical protein